MAVFVMFVFVLILTISAYWPGRGIEESSAYVSNRGKVAAGYLVAYHAAAARACNAGGTPCGAGVIQPAAVTAQMPSYYVATASQFSDGRFGSYSDGKYLYTYFTGRGYGIPNREMGAITLGALYSLLGAEALASAGMYDASTGYFQPRNNVFTVPDGTLTVAGPGLARPMNNLNYGVSLNDASPVLSTRLLTN